MLLSLSDFGKWEGYRAKAKWMVIILFVFIAGASYANAFRVAEKVTPKLEMARKVIGTLPEKKKVMMLWGGLPYLGSIGIGGHLDAYYVMDRKGYTPKLFCNNFMLVRYKQRLESNVDPKKMTGAMLKQYDGLFVWGDNVKLNQQIRGYGFHLLHNKGPFSTYLQNELLTGRNRPR